MSRRSNRDSAKREKRSRRAPLRRLLVRLVVNGAALWVAAELVPNMEFDGRVLDLMLVAAVFGLVNALIRPVAKLLTLPLRIATLGLFTLVVNAAMLVITAAISDSLDFDGGLVEEFVAALVASVAVSIVSFVLSRLLPDGP